jgi:hypothetical protein
MLLRPYRSLNGAAVFLSVINMRPTGKSASLA